MKKYLLAAVAVAAISSPAYARDGQAYVGIEGGIMFPKDQNGDAFVDYTTVQTAPTTVVVGAPAGPADAVFGNALDTDFRRGYDIDALIGYDFGMFRLEGEFGYKRAKRDGFEPDAAFLTSLNAALNRPSAAPDPGAPAQAALTEADFDQFDGKIGLKSAMINGLVDFGD